MAGGSSREEESFYAILLAGGKGTRFWPASRASHPKQFLRLLGDRSLLQLTWDRFARLVPVERIVVVTNPALAERTREELPDLLEANLILEPVGRDTAPAAALAARVLLEREEDPLLLVAPTDHYIRDESAFAAALGTALEAARKDALVTFGVVPERPATVYGYIEVESRPAGGVAEPVLSFREKPTATQAAEFIATGRFFWNSGIFVWRAVVFEEELRIASPSLADAIAGLSPAISANAADHGLFARGWERLPSISLDYALMEKARRVRLVALDAGWSDLGGWSAMRALLPSDVEGNRLSEDVLYVGARNCSVHRAGSAGARRLIVLAATEGLVVVETDDAVLVCRADAGEELRETVLRLKEAGREDLL